MTPFVEGSQQDGRAKNILGIAQLLRCVGVMLTHTRKTLAGMALNWRLWFHFVAAFTRCIVVTTEGVIEMASDFQHCVRTSSMWSTLGALLFSFRE